MVRGTQRHSMPLYLCLWLCCLWGLVAGSPKLATNDAELVAFLADDSVNNIQLASPVALSSQTAPNPIPLLRNVTLQGSGAAVLTFSLAITTSNNLSSSSALQQLVTLGPGVALTLANLTVVVDLPRVSAASLLWPADAGPLPGVNISTSGAIALLDGILFFHTLRATEVPQAVLFFANYSDLQSQLPSMSILTSQFLDPRPLSGQFSSRVQFSSQLVFPRLAGHASYGGCAYVPGSSVAYDSLSLHNVLKAAEASAVFLYSSILLSPLDFNYTTQIVLGPTRNVTVYACIGTVLDTNYHSTRHSIAVRGGHLTLGGGFNVRDSEATNRVAWPQLNGLLLGSIDLDANGTVVLSNLGVDTPDSGNLTRFLTSYTAKPAPVLGSVNSAAGTVVIHSWQLPRQSWLATGWDTSLAATTLNPTVPLPDMYYDNSTWVFQDVRLTYNPRSSCFEGNPGIQAATGRELRDLIKDDLISKIQIVNNITFVPSEWPPEASGPAEGQIFVKAGRDLHIRGCTSIPGARFTVDLANLGQVVFVYGNLTWDGNLLMVNPKASPRRAWLYLLVGALSVEADGIIQFTDVEIQSNSASPFHNPDDKFWAMECGTLCPYFIPNQQDFISYSPYSSLIYNYQFWKAPWVNVSQGRDYNGTGYWGYTDVVLSWWPSLSGPSPPSPSALQPPPSGSNGSGGGSDGGDEGGSSTNVAAIAAPVVVGSVLVIAVVVGLLLYKRSKSGSSSADPDREPASLSGVVIQRADPSNPTARRGSTNLGGKSAETGTGGAVESSSSGGPNKGRQGSSLPSNPQGCAPSDTGLQGMVAKTPSSTSKGTSAKAQIEDMKARMAAVPSMAAAGHEDDIQLLDQLGEGTFGKVYKGTWRGTPVAIKTIVFPAAMSGREKREKMAIMETAISSLLSHPNVVQTYTYAIKPIYSEASVNKTPVKKKEEAEEEEGDSGALVIRPPSLPPSASAATLLERKDSNLHSWEVRLVLELCDRGSLRDALDAKIFRIKPSLPGTPTRSEASISQHRLSLGAAAAAAATAATAAGNATDPSDSTRSVAGSPTAAGTPGGLGAGTINMGWVVDTALDAARAMLHLHHENVVHSDLKARNILLKSNGSDSRGFTAKVSDFGLSFKLDPTETHVSNLYQGTMTHMAPEVLVHGKISKASDVYAFGILMWELYTGGHAFKGIPKALLGHDIAKTNLRPQFPPDTPLDYTQLAARCWEGDPAIRPTFDQVVQELLRLQRKMTGRGAEDSPAMLSLQKQASGGLECTRDTPMWSPAAPLLVLPPQGASSFTMEQSESTAAFMAEDLGDSQTLEGSEDPSRSAVAMAPPALHPISEEGSAAALSTNPLLISLHHFALAPGGTEGEAGLTGASMRTGMTLAACSEVLLMPADCTEDVEGPTLPPPPRQA